MIFLMEKRRCQFVFGHVLMDDISNGKEKMSVRVLNMLDNERAPLFCYLANGTCNVESLLSACDWIDGCSYSKDWS
jgi:hypothetical protein